MNPYTNATDVIKDMTLNGLVAKLPGVQLDPKLYGQVKKQMEQIGGKWKGGRTFGFVFEEDPAGHFERLRGGEKVNLQQQFQAFFTPEDVAERMVELADIRPGNSILEPSAGEGAIVKAVHRRLPRSVVAVYELQDALRAKLAVMPDVQVLGDDFLRENPASWATRFDRVVANPPFTRNLDIDHIMQMQRALNPGGVMVTIASTSWLQGSQRKQVEFKELVEQWNTHFEILPSGTFKDTHVETVLLRLPEIPF